MPFTVWDNLADLQRVQGLEGPDGRPNGMSESNLFLDKSFGILGRSTHTSLAKAGRRLARSRKTVWALVTTPRVNPCHRFNGDGSLGKPDTRFHPVIQAGEKAWRRRMGAGFGRRLGEGES